MADEPTRSRGTDSDLHAEAEEARRVAFPDTEELRKYRDYARGKQRQTLTREQQKALKAGAVKAVDNKLFRILTTLTDRINVTGYRCEDQAVQSFLDDLLVKAYLHALFTQVVYATWRDGNAGVTLNYSKTKARVTINREKWWNGKSGIFFAYDDDGEPTYAVKEWKTAKNETRRTFYYPGSTRRYIHRQGLWSWFTDDGGPAGPTPWTINGQEGGPPMGMAAVHFARLVDPPDGDEHDRSNDRDPNYGVSFLSGGLLDLQDIVNEFLKLVNMAGRFTAFQIPTGTGVKVKTDPATGQEIPPKVEPGTMLTSDDTASRYGFIPAGSIEQLSRGRDIAVDALAENANVPTHVIRGQWPSGEAIMRAELPLNMQARKAAEILGQPFGSVAHKAVQINNAYGGTALNTQALIITLFEPPERYDPLTVTELANNRADYVSLKEVHRLYGYDTKRSQRIIREMSKEASFRSPDEEQDPRAAVAALAAAADKEDAAEGEVVE